MFVIMNNQYAMGGQTVGETMGWKEAARIGAGINPDRMHAEKVNGNDPLAVIDAFTRKKEILTRGEGPVLLELLTYRTCSHSASDAESYRTPEEIDAWEAVDPIKMFRNKLVRNHIVSELEIETLRDTIVRRMTKICKEGRKIDKRFEKLNKNYLKPGEIVYIQHLRGDKMEAMLSDLTYDASK